MTGSVFTSALLSEDVNIRTARKYQSGHLSRIARRVGLCSIAAPAAGARRELFV